MDLTQIFCDVDDFYQAFEPRWLENLVTIGLPFKPRRRKLVSSEVMTILIMFHQSHYRDLKSYYLRHVCVFLSSEFPNLPSYQRFVELQRDAMVSFFFLMCKKLGKCSGISLIDSTKLIVSHNRRAKQHKTFGPWATWGKDSIGWFFGFKLHLVINDIGEILAFRITPANCDDRSMVASMMQGLFGRLYGDKGYISKNLCEELTEQGITLLTRIRKNMKPQIMSLFDRIMLRKRVLIETVNDHLKNNCHLEHSRHRSPFNFVVHLLACLVSYSMSPKKPSLDVRKEQGFSIVA